MLTFALSLFMDGHSHSVERSREERRGGKEAGTENRTHPSVSIALDVHHRSEWRKLVCECDFCQVNQRKEKINK